MNFEDEVLKMLEKVNRQQVRFQESMDNMQEKMNHFQENMNSSQKDMNKIHESMHGFQKDMDKIHEGMNSSQKDMDKIQADVDGFQGNVNNFQKGVNKRFDKLGSDLIKVKEQTDKIPEMEHKTSIIYQEVISLREDVTMSKQQTEDIEKEQAYQLSKWVEHDRRISKLERKILS